MMMIVAKKTQKKTIKSMVEKIVFIDFEHRAIVSESQAEGLLEEAEVCQIH